MSEDVSWLRRKIIVLILVVVTYLVIGVLLFLFVDLLPDLFAYLATGLPENLEASIVLFIQTAVIATFVLSIVWQLYGIWEKWERGK